MNNNYMEENLNDINKTEIKIDESADIKTGTETTPQKNTVKDILLKIKQKKILIPIIVIILIILFTAVALGKNILSKSSNSENPTPTPITTPTSTPTPTPSPTPATTSSSTKITPTIIKTTTTLTPTPKPSSNNSVTNSPTVTPPQEKPVVNITYPTDGQTITFSDSSQSLCVVSVPVSNTQGVQFYYNLNNSGWQDGYCFSPPVGANSLQFKVKNSGNLESDIYSRSFTIVHNY